MTTVMVPVRYPLSDHSRATLATAIEVAAEGADVVVIGNKQVGRWRQTVRRLLDDPDVATFLESELDCQIVTASVE